MSRLEDLSAQAARWADAAPGGAPCCGGDCGMDAACPVSGSCSGGGEECICGGAAADASCSSGAAGAGGAAPDDGACAGAAGGACCGERGPATGGPRGGVRPAEEEEDEGDEEEQQPGGCQSDSVPSSMDFSLYGDVAEAPGEESTADTAAATAATAAAGGGAAAAAGGAAASGGREGAVAQEGGEEEEEDYDAMCGVCYEAPAASVTLRGCNHKLCTDCARGIVAWTSSGPAAPSCPFCRATISGFELRAADASP
jgi:hypothetical protein